MLTLGLQGERHSTSEMCQQQPDRRDKQRQADGVRTSQTDEHRQAGRWMRKRRQAGRQAGRQTDRQTDRRADRRTDGLTDRQTDRQAADGHSDGQTDTKRQTEEGACLPAPLPQRHLQ